MTGGVTTARVPLPPWTSSQSAAARSGPTSLLLVWKTAPQSLLLLKQEERTRFCTARPSQLTFLEGGPCPSSVGGI